MKEFKQKVKKTLTMSFNDKRMEKEYSMIKTENSLNDFKACAAFVLILNIIGIIGTSITKRWNTFFIVVGSILGVLILFPFTKCVRKQYQYLTSLVLINFCVNRLVITHIEYDYYSKVTIYFAGYVYAIVEMAALSKIQNFYFQTFCILLFLVGRYISLNLADPAGFNIYAWFRFFFADIFIIYIMYSNEKTARRVFRRFYQNREELVKFKELLDDSLPQSVIVMDLKTQRQLFANNAFASAFDNDESVELNGTEELEQEENIQRKPHLNMVRIDFSTLREVGAQPGESRFLNMVQSSYSPKDLIKKLSDDNLIEEKALSVNAASKYQEKQRTLEITLKKIKWDTIDAVAMILNDTTYQENLVALKLANINKDQIIATVSHELRTPLHGIIGLLEIAESRIQDEEALSHLSLCRDNAYLLSSLVNSLLDLQQLSRGKLKLNEAKINVSKTLRDVVNLFKFQTDQKNIGLEYLIHNDVPKFVTTDENRFKQILINLIGNAIKFTFKGGVKVEVSQDPKHSECLIISVNDTGIGIKEEDIGKLFKMYGKLANSSTVNKNGVGLGLTISGTLAALLNGQDDEKGVEVESQYGVGSKFFFRILKDLTSSNCGRIDRFDSMNQLNDERDDQGVSTTEREDSVAFEYSDELANPLTLSSKLSNYSWKGNITHSFQKNGKGFETETETKPKESQEMLLSSQQETKNLKDQLSRRQSEERSAQECILVVDDNPFNILVAKSLLKNIGYEVKSASGGQEAIKIVQSCTKEGIRIRVIFLDCQMPIMDGYETARTLEGMMERGEVPRVAMLAWTANTGEQDIKKCYESGMTGYLTKPTTRENVLKVIPK